MVKCCWTFLLNLSYGPLFCTGACGGKRIPWNRIRRLKIRLTTDGNFKTATPSCGGLLISAYTDDSCLVCQLSHPDRPKHTSSGIKLDFGQWQSLGMNCRQYTYIEFISFTRSTSTLNARKFAIKPELEVANTQLLFVWMCMTSYLK